MEAPKIWISLILLIAFEPGTILTTGVSYEADSIAVLTPAKDDSVIELNSEYDNLHPVFLPFSTIFEKLENFIDESGTNEENKEEERRKIGDISRHSKGKHVKEDEDDLELEATSMREGLLEQIDAGELDVNDEAHRKAVSKSDDSNEEGNSSSSSSSSSESDSESDENSKENVSPRSRGCGCLNQIQDQNQNKNQNQNENENEIQVIGDLDDGEEEDVDDRQTIRFQDLNLLQLGAQFIEDLSGGLDIFQIAEHALDTLIDDRKHNRSFGAQNILILSAAFGFTANLQVKNGNGEEAEETTTTIKSILNQDTMTIAAPPVVVVNKVEYRVPPQHEKPLIESLEPDTVVQGYYHNSGREMKSFIIGIGSASAFFIVLVLVWKLTNKNGPLDKVALSDIK